MKNSLSIVLSGEAGQGLQTIEELVVSAASDSYHVFSVKDLMSRVRGGNNTVEIRISSESIHAFQHSIDLLFLLNEDAFYRLKDRVSHQTTIFTEAELKLNEMAKEAGGSILMNVILFGLIGSLLKLDKNSCTMRIQGKFKNKSEKIIEDNLKAFELGYQKGSYYSISKQIDKTAFSRNYKTIDGN
nr:2-oxoacid:acceptor oxidoreductase family protein [Clostridia bacterium]